MRRRATKEQLKCFFLFRFEIFHSSDFFPFCNFVFLRYEWRVAGVRSSMMMMSFGALLRLGATAFVIIAIFAFRWKIKKFRERSQARPVFAYWQ